MKLNEQLKTINLVPVFLLLVSLLGTNICQSMQKNPYVLHVYLLKFNKYCNPKKKCDTEFKHEEIVQLNDQCKWDAITLLLNDLQHPYLDRYQEFWFDRVDSPNTILIKYPSFLPALRTFNKLNTPEYNFLILKVKLEKYNQNPKRTLKNEQQLFLDN